MFHKEANYDLVLENSKLTMVELMLLLKRPTRINTVAHEMVYMYNVFIVITKGPTTPVDIL